MISGYTGCNHSKWYSTSVVETTRSQLWIVLVISGKLFRSNDLPFVIEFILMFYRDKPVDWLLDHLLYVKVCSPERDMVSHCWQFATLVHDTLTRYFRIYIYIYIYVYVCKCVYICCSLCSVAKFLEQIWSSLPDWVAKLLCVFTSNFDLFNAVCTTNSTVSSWFQFVFIAGNFVRIRTTQTIK